MIDLHAEDARVIELVGAIGFADADYLTRLVSSRQSSFVTVDWRRVPSVTEGAARLIGTMIRNLTSVRATVVFSGIERDSRQWAVLSQMAGPGADVRRFDLLDEAIEWVEDQMIYRHGGFDNENVEAPLEGQVLLQGLSEADLAELRALCVSRDFHIGEKIVAANEPAGSLLFLLGGRVSVKLPSGVRLASLSQGMVVGEMALIESARSADIWADTAVKALELHVDRFAEFSERCPAAGQRVFRNLAALLSKRLIQSNLKVDLLSAY